MAIETEISSVDVSQRTQLKTLIAIPCMDTVPVAFMNSLINLRKPDGTRYATLAGSLVYDSRNLLAASSITSPENYTRVLWLDSDMDFEPDSLLRLNQTMDETGADVVCGIYFKRKPPTMPVVYSRIDWDTGPEGAKAHAEIIRDYPRDSVFEIAGCGFGMVLMKVQLIKDVWDQCGAPFDPMPHMGEDLSFCYKANKVGARMLCDSRVKAGHIGTWRYDEAMYLNQKDVNVQ